MSSDIKNNLAVITFAIIFASFGGSGIFLLTKNQAASYLIFTSLTFHFALLIEGNNK